MIAREPVETPYIRATPAVSAYQRTRSQSGRKAGILSDMAWEQSLVDQLDLAFNEATVCGLAFDSETCEARLIVEVLALPEAGPIDNDPRRIVVFSEVSSVEVILRADTDPLGPVLPLASLAELEAFFASLGQADAMYGWTFVDIADPGENWCTVPSLTMGAAAGASEHSIHWFTECGRAGANEDWERYFLQGVVRFGALRVERADGRSVAVEDFVADARRWWDAFQGRDPRLSTDAQQQARTAAKTWRDWGGTAVMVPGKSS